MTGPASGPSSEILAYGSTGNSAVDLVYGVPGAGWRLGRDAALHSIPIGMGLAAVAPLAGTRGGFRRAAIAAVAASLALQGARVLWAWLGMKEQGG